jgi:hypothetical protein
MLPCCYPLGKCNASSYGLCGGMCGVQPAVVGTACVPRLHSLTETAALAAALLWHEYAPVYSPYTSEHHPVADRYALSPGHRACLCKSCQGYHHALGGGVLFLAVRAAFAVVSVCLSLIPPCPGWWRAVSCSQGNFCSCFSVPVIARFPFKRVVV